MAGWREGGRAGLLPAALLAFCTLWRLPSLADPPWLNDEGTYATVGRALVEGEALYRQIWENKPPGVYLLYGAVHLLVGPEHLLLGVRILSLLASVAILLAVYRVATCLRDRWAGALALLFAGILVDLPLLDGTSANAEIFLAAATSAGMALVLPSLVAPASVNAQGLAHGSQDGRRLGRDPLPSSSFPVAGAAFGLALLLKLVAGTDLLAALLIAVWPAAGCGLRTRLGRAGWLLMGAIVPVGGVVIWLAARGLLGDALYATVGYNRGYVATGQSLHALPLTVATLAVPLALLAFAAWLVRRQGGATITPAAATALWLALALIGALASGRSYPHYYLQVAPPVALAMALLVSYLCGRAGTLQRRVLIALIGCWSIGVPLGSWLALRHEPAHPRPGSDAAGYYAHAWQHLTGSLDDSGYGDRLDPRVERNLATIRYLTEHPSTPRRLYIWGNVPWVYYVSRYQHAARFISAYYRPAIPGGVAQVQAQLLASLPPYILVIAPPAPASAPLSALLRARYRPVYRVQDATIYRLRAS